MDMRIFLGLLLALGPLLADGIPRDEYRARRADLRKSLDGVLVLFAPKEPEDIHEAFYQEANFLYLTGWNEPGAVLMIAPKEEILFLPPRDPRIEIYNGRRATAEDS